MQNLKRRSEPLYLLLSLDVEEEGLFGGSYAKQDVSVNNVSQLYRLESILAKYALPVNLLCTHSVFANKSACQSIDKIRNKIPTEIGAHLHHWNTPPLAANVDQNYLSPGLLDSSLFAERLHSLFSIGQNFTATPLTSFRMGKWDLHKWHWPYLLGAGVKVDASVRPLHYNIEGPNHFYAPTEPYFVPINNGTIIEAPLTCIPMFSCFSNKFSRLEGGGQILPRQAVQQIKASIQKCLALAMLPVYHPLWAMKLITAMYLARGGRFLTLTWHSSEMMPGGAPHMPNEAAVAAFINKIDLFLNWLHNKTAIQGLLFNQLIGNEHIKQICAVEPKCDYIY